MAIIKHIASRNSHYDGAVEYLIYEHDAKTGKVLRDEFGTRVPRENILIDGINCSPDTYELECLETNKRYNKNFGREDIKSHSYIISFDPRDVSDNGLTAEAVQKFGLEFAKKYLPGYQTVVCTHSDGHNHSGNLHCHIIINSIRSETVERMDFMDQETDNIAGFKHRWTKRFEYFAKQKVMDMCRERGLYQTDLINPAPRRVTDKEYYSSLRMQYSAENDAVGTMTNKDKIRFAIETSAAAAGNLQDFKKLMEESYRIPVKESRGRFSYLLPGRERGITDRQLGSEYTKAFLEKVIRREEIFSRPTEKPEYDKYVRPDIGRIVDIAANEKAQESAGYAYRLKLSNLKKTAESINYLTGMGVRNTSDISDRINSLTDALLSNGDLIREKEKRMKELKEISALADDYRRLKKIADSAKSGRESAAFRKEHEGDLIFFKSVKESLREKLDSGKLPSAEKLKKEYAALEHERDILYEDRSQLKKDLIDVQNAKANLEMTGSRGREKDMQL